MRKRIRIFVYGNVQGVSFRYYASERARQDEIAGWVRNRKDGSVELVAEGEEGAVERFLAWCRNGPTAARVKSLEVCEEPPEFIHGFAIRT